MNRSVLFSSAFAATRHGRGGELSPRAANTDANDFVVSATETPQ